MEDQDKINKRILKNEYMRRYRKKNLEYVKNYRKKNYFKYKEKAKEYKKEWYQKNKKRLKQKRKDYYLNNKENILKSQKQYILKNKEKYKEYIKKYNVSRRKRDISFKILGALRSRLNKFINNKFKSKKTLELIGCTIDNLKKHLESQFKQNMSWYNYGIKGWHIDHIIPCYFFNLKNFEEQKKCFHYTNLQPLWWWENLSKGCKYKTS
jgi:hypothetical protein